MRLYTIQPIIVYDILKQQKVFRSTPEKSSYYNKDDELNMIPAYDWMIEQMEQRVGPRPNGVVIPIWAWYKFDDETKPDMRKHKTERPYCVIQFEKDEKDVLLSDFDLWHFVLNDCYFADVLTDEEYEKVEKWYDSMDPKSQQAIDARRKSWESIFNCDVDPNDTQNFIGRGHYVQATFWELFWDDIVKVKFYGRGVC